MISSFIILKNFRSQGTIGLVVFIFCHSLWAITGKVYKMGSQQKDQLFSISSETKIENDNEVFTMRFFDMKGVLAVEESAYFKNDVIYKYTVDYKRRNQKGTIEVKDKKIFFEYTKDGEISKGSESLEDNFVVGLSVKRYLQKNWQDLTQGKSIKVRLGVVDRKETVGFSFFREKKKETDANIMVVKMKPSSWVISALVAPLYFYFDLRTKDLVKLIGRTKPKIQESGQWKDLDAETVYDTPLSQPSTSQK
ncbi:MAG: hypothetical protein KDD50_06505 [Bdellovibrionales bacterium]|nr:hypothetical protein [Bdellovibrionales bacterium]